MPGESHKLREAGNDRWGHLRLVLSTFVINTLNQHAVDPWFLDSGTLLGAHRSHQLIKSDDDFDLFRSSMGDVKPIKAEPKVRLKSETASKEVLRARREAAQALDESVNGPLSVDYVQQVEAQAVLSFMRPGIQHSLFKNCDSKL